MRYKPVAAVLAITCVILTIAAVWLLIENSSAKKAEKAADYYKRLSDEIKAVAGIKGNINDLHIHADFKVVMDGKQINFMRKDFDEKNALVHLHIGSSETENPDHEEDDKVIHVESRGITLGHFFTTLGMKFTSRCFVADESSHCSNEQDKLMMFVNGERNNELDNYELKNRDKILIIYGSYTEKELKDQINSVSDYAKNYG